MAYMLRFELANLEFPPPIRRRVESLCKSLRLFLNRLYGVFTIWVIVLCSILFFVWGIKGPSHMQQSSGCRCFADDH